MKDKIKKEISKSVDKQTIEMYKVKKEKDLISQQTKPKERLGYFAKKKLKKDGILITMCLTNGNYKEFILNTKFRKFEHKKKTYIVDEERIYYHLGQKCAGLLYHENVPLPISLVGEGKQSYKLKIDTTALTSVIKMEYVELLTKISSFKDKIVIILLVSVISGVFSLLTFVLMLKQMGIIGS